MDSLRFTPGTLEMHQGEQARFSSRYGALDEHRDIRAGKQSRERWGQSRRGGSSR